MSETTPQDQKAIKTADETVKILETIGHAASFCTADPVDLRKAN